MREPSVKVLPASVLVQQWLVVDLGGYGQLYMVLRWFRVVFSGLPAVLGGSTCTLGGSGGFCLVLVDPKCPWGFRCLWALLGQF